MNILGFDPGKDKCGIAIMTSYKVILNHQVIKSDEVMPIIRSLCEKYKIKKIVLGNQTTSKEWRKKLEEELPFKISINMVDERNSTLEAKDFYWVINPPQGLTKLIPQGLRIPPRPIDDIVAIILVNRYLDKVIPTLDRTMPEEIP